MESVKRELKLIIVRGLRLSDEAVENFRDDQALLGSDLEIDSIDILQIILEIERHFGIKLVTGKFEKDVWSTIDTLAAAIEAKIVEEQKAQAGFGL